jgi:tetratricopeptide (TPR) repeat protein
MTIDSIPVPLQQSIEGGNAVLFIGAGAGHNVFNKKGENAPDGNELCKRIIRDFNLPTEDEHYPLSSIAEYAELKVGRKVLEQFIKKQLDGFEPDENLIWLSKVQWRAIYTTNYDNFIELAYSQSSIAMQNIIPISITADLKQVNWPHEVPLYYLHGALFHSTPNDIIITDTDYSRFQTKRTQVFSKLKDSFAESVFLYFGYSNQDPNWLKLLDELRNEFKPSNLSKSYRIDPFPKQAMVEILKIRDNIETLECDLETFKNVFFQTKQSETSLIYPDLYKGFVPPRFLNLREKHPALTDRVFTNWSHVNSEDFTKDPNIKSFVRGDIPNWSLLLEGLHFQRDLTDSISDELLDFVTDPQRKTNSYLILGPAGYGTTTLMMSLATLLVKENACNCFWLKNNKLLNYGDIEFIIQNVEGKSILFIDNAVENVFDFRTVLDKCSKEKYDVCFVLGARQNEWRAQQVTIKIKEYLLETLSDNEISLLLECLTKNKELGVLNDIDHEDQIKIIKNKHNKQLLVVLREATEGRTFDAILEDEYNKLSTEITKNAYLNVCCFHQYGVHIRTGLLCKLLKVGFTDFYSDIKSYGEGVFSFQTIDEFTGEEAIGARHRIIAEIVWRRCGNEHLRDDIIKKSMSVLNIMYPIDRTAFDKMCMDDELVDSILSLEGKTEFFENACKKDPSNPYVRQHFARMLLRESLYELALSQIDQAISLDSNSRILYHTKGTILKRLCINSESQAIALKFLSRSEQAFKNGIALKENDDYCYAGLAELYLDFATGCESEEQITRYLTSAEDCIEKGLKVVKSQESLLIISSKIQDFLGHKPESISALERAYEANPSSIIVPYLLAKYNYRNDNFQKVIDLLNHITTFDFTRTRCFVLYAKANYALNQNYSKSISRLRLAETYGLKDTEFLSTLGGMLFMNGDFDKADVIFNRGKLMWIPLEEKHKVRFRPIISETDTSAPLLTGVVMSVKAGFSFISCSGFPDIFCPSSEHFGTLIAEGQKVTFNPEFTVRGAIAANITILK